MNIQPVTSTFDEELFGFDFLAELDREEIEDQANYLTASDVHSDGPLTKFKVCQSCSGSTAPTCKQNKQCLAEKAFK